MSEEITFTVSEKPIDGKYRIFGSDGQIATRTDNGNPLDFGGQEDRDKLVRMAGHIAKSVNEKQAKKESEENG